MNFKKKMMKFIIVNKSRIVIFSIILICSLAIAIGVYAEVTNKKIINIGASEEEYLELKENFNKMFNSEENKYIYTIYDINEEKNGEYSVDIKIPHLRGDTKGISSINTDIENVFVNKLKQIANRDRRTYNI